MRRNLKFVALAIAVLLLSIGAARAQNNLVIYGDVGVEVTCDDGTEITNGVEIALLLRPGYSYTATVLGIDGFDPLVAVTWDSRHVDCNDDNPLAETYTADLPETLPIASSARNAQIEFSPTSKDELIYTSLVVAGAKDAPVGEFLTIIEGLSITPADAQFDPMQITVTKGMQASGVPITVYMVGLQESLDPVIWLEDGQSNPAYDDEGKPVACDDAGSTNCPDYIGSLTDYQVSTKNNNVINLDVHDSAMLMDLDYLTLETNDNYWTFDLTVAEPQQTGRYLVAVHSGVAMPESRSGINAGSGSFATVVEPTPEQLAKLTGFTNGEQVDCPDSPAIENGVPFHIEVPNGSYIVTAMGVDGFDPQLGLYDDEGNILCNDNNEDAAQYDANLPTSGKMKPSKNSAQIIFNHRDTGFLDVTIVVGGKAGQSGEFLLVIENMQFKGNDLRFTSVQVTPGMIASGMPVTLYMIAEYEGLDPYLQYEIPVGDYWRIVKVDGRRIQCGDSGTATCWGENAGLSSSYVGSSNLGEYQKLYGALYNSMLRVPIINFPLADDPKKNEMLFLPTGYTNVSDSTFTLVYHVKTADLPQ